jgi:hypothetical protein
LDVWKSKLNFAKLPDVVLNRYALLMDRHKTIPALVVEDAASGTQLIDTIRSRSSDMVRAEGVTPITTAGLVALPRDAPWRAEFIKG